MGKLDLLTKKKKAKEKIKEASEEMDRISKLRNVKDARLDQQLIEKAEFILKFAHNAKPDFIVSRDFYIKELSNGTIVGRIWNDIFYTRICNKKKYLVLESLKDARVGEEYYNSTIDSTLVKTSSVEIKRNKAKNPMRNQRVYTSIVFEHNRFMNSREYIDLRDNILVHLPKEYKSDIYELPKINDYRYH